MMLDYDEEDRGSREIYNILHVRKKIKKFGKLKVTILSVCVLLLVMSLLTIAILYHKKNNTVTKNIFVSSLSNKTATASIATTKTTTITTKQTKRSPLATLQTATMESETPIIITEPIQTTISIMTVPPPTNTDKNKSHRNNCQRCVCNKNALSVKDRKSGKCKDVKFAINFLRGTTVNVPEIKHVTFPKTGSISVCFWYKLSRFVGEKMHAIFTYSSEDIYDSDDFMMWLSAKNEIHVTMKSDKKRILEKIRLPLNKWEHLCWTWTKTGSWILYMSGKIKESGVSRIPSFKESFPESIGTLTLGQDKDNNKINDREQMFRGQITQFYLYHKTLNAAEVRSAFRKNPPTDSIIVGWWQFKDKTNGEDIVLSKYPFKD